MSATNRDIQTILNSIIDEHEGEHFYSGAGDPEPINEELIGKLKALVKALAEVRHETK